MRTLHFKNYSLANGSDRPVIEMWDRGFRSLPVDLARENVMHQLQTIGFDTDHPENLRVGFLAAPWQGHPRLAMVVAGSINLLNGEEVAVSLEPAPPPPAGKFFGDPTLPEIRDEAYRQRNAGVAE